MFRFVMALLAALPAAAAAQQTRPATPAASGETAPVRIVAVDVQPAQAAPDTLCRLKVKIRNDGSEPASDLMFQVTVAGKRLAVYVNHVFTPDLAPGKETEVPLYNFWSSETGRPFPKDGQLVVEVQVTAAHWRSKAAGAAPRDVKPLPAAVSVTLPPRAPK